MTPSRTLVALAILGTTASARAESVEPLSEAAVVTSDVGVSRRGVAQDYLVLPSGGELTGQMRFLTSEPSLGGQEMKFTDHALFGIGGRWALLSRLEISLEASFLAKQPSFTDEKPWQSVGGGLRSPISRRTAVQLAAAGGHLIDHEGMWTREALMLQWRKPIADLVTFDIAGGIDGVSLTAPRRPSGMLSEVALTTSALFREPTGHWGAWLGMSYAVPVIARGVDPTSGVMLDPQPRLDFRVGTVWAVVEQWDLFAELAVVDRGDLEDPATRLPIL